jgi:DNA-binding CsgD family transcriptional regulator
MVTDELLQFLQYNDVYKNMCSELLDSLHLNENTVVAFTRCGTKTGTGFLSQNFTRIFGYPRMHFIKGDLQFLIKHMHPDDLPAFTYFAETSTLNATTWEKAKEGAVHECCSRFIHANGKWMWIKQKVIVLSVTPDRHIDQVLLLFDDCTASKQAELSQRASLVEKSRKYSKLLDVLAPVSNAQTKRENRMLALQDHASLTQREREIIQFVSQGYSSKEIAAQLFISKHTVESHRKHILQKLRAKNTPHMVHQSLILSVEERF